MADTPPNLLGIARNIAQNGRKSIFKTRYCNSAQWIYPGSYTPWNHSQRKPTVIRIKNMRTTQKAKREPIVNKMVAKGNKKIIGQIEGNNTLN